MSIADILKEIAKHQGSLIFTSPPRTGSVVVSLYMGEFSPEKRAVCALDWLATVADHEEAGPVSHQTYVLRKAFIDLLNEAKRKAGIPIS